jgi:hypothetical protein
MTKKAQGKLEELATYFDKHDFSAEMEEGKWVTPETETEPMITTSLRLPRSVMDAVRSEANGRGIKPTQLVREWVEERLARSGKLEDVPIPASALLAFIAEQQSRRAA